MNEIICPQSIWIPLTCLTHHVNSRLKYFINFDIVLFVFRVISVKVVMAA